MVHMYDPIVADNQLKYVTDCINHNQLTFHGHYIKEFEQKLSSLIGMKHCITVFNGSVAINAALMSIKATQEVHTQIIVPSMTYIATVSQAVLSGFTPLFVDCDKNFQIDLNQLEEVGKRHKSLLPKTVLVPELYADAPNMKELTRLCHKHNFILVEDAAEAFGCKTLGKSLGSFGLASTFSFFANKIITTGEGGCVMTNDDKLASYLRLYRNQGNLGYYRHIGPCSNLRMTNIQAAIGVAQLEYLREIITRKVLTAKAYRATISPRVEQVIPKVEFSSEWMPVFRLPDEVKFAGLHALGDAYGFEVRPCFYPVHLMEGFRDYPKLSLTNSEAMADRYFILPCGPSLEDWQREFITKKVNWFLEEGRSEA